MKNIPWQLVLGCFLLGGILGRLTAPGESEESKVWRAQAELVAEHADGLMKRLDSANAHNDTLTLDIQRLEAKVAARPKAVPTILSHVITRSNELGPATERVVYLEGVVAKMVVTESRLLETIADKDSIIADWAEKYETERVSLVEARAEIGRLVNIIGEAPALKKCTVIFGIPCPSQAVTYVAGILTTFVIIRAVP